jgi:hypothetical protein
MGALQSTHQAEIIFFVDNRNMVTAKENAGLWMFEASPRTFEVAKL